MITRITADIDHLHIHTILNDIASTIALFHFSINTLSIVKSNSKGYHVIIWSNEELSNRKIFKIREMLGDDAKRIAMDKKRKRPKQYLFKEKKYLR